MFHDTAVPRTLKEQWDLPLVLDYLRGPLFEPLDKATFRNLTRKTVFLLQVASQRRVSWTQACHTSPAYTRFEDDGVTFVPYLPYEKNTTETWSPSPVHILEFRKFSPEDEVYCPIRSLKHYIRVADTLRGPEKALFIKSREPHSRATRATVSGWIRSIIKEAYTASQEDFPPDVDFRAHSTRGVSSTWALVSGVSIQEIMDSAAWKDHRTFGTFYQGDPITRANRNVAFRVLTSAAAVLRTREAERQVHRS